MTPFGLRLQLELDRERGRMGNEWFSKWHYIGGQTPVEIDGFDGRKIRYGGIKFTGSPRAVYWATLARYLKLKNREVFDKAEEELKTSPSSQIEDTISDTRALMESFTRTIAHDAVELDRILRGDGRHFPPPDQHETSRLMILYDISRRAESLRTLYRSK
jgi:hypothetical protein